LLPLVVLVAAAAVAAELYASQPAPTYAVPWLVGDSAVGARTALGSEHLDMAVTASQWDRAVKGSVIAQFPQPNVKLHANATVSVTVSLGPEPVRVPDLATLDLSQAATSLRSAGLRLGTVRHRTSIAFLPAL
jgi:serine/threonine-protein kinase